MPRRRLKPTGDPAVDLPRRRPWAAGISDDELVAEARTGVPGGRYVGWPHPAVGLHRFVICRWRRGRLPWKSRSTEPDHVIFFMCQAADVGANGLRLEASFWVHDDRSRKPWLRNLQALKPFDRLVVRLLRTRPPRNPDEPIDPQRFVGVNILGTARLRRSSRGKTYSALDVEEIRLATRGRALKPFDNRLLTGSKHPEPSKPRQGLDG